LKDALWPNSAGGKKRLLHIKGGSVGGSRPRLLGGGPDGHFNGAIPWPGGGKRGKRSRLFKAT